MVGRLDDLTQGAAKTARHAELPNIERVIPAPVLQTVKRWWCRGGCVSQLDDPMPTEPETQSYFAMIPNHVFEIKMRYPVRQIYLILEFRAGKSRVAKLTNRELAGLAAYPLRTVERALQKLREFKLLGESTTRHKTLMLPYPDEKFVRAYESIVFHPTWCDWQKHILLFVMSQYRGTRLGQDSYALNLSGTIAPSIEQRCSIPGKTQERREKIAKFRDELVSEGLISIIINHSGGMPAICRINFDSIRAISPRYPNPVVTVTPNSPVPAQTVRNKAVCANKTDRHLSRSGTVSSHVADRHPSRSGTVISHVAAPSALTYEEDKEDPKESEKVWKTPFPPSAGAISSLDNDDTVGGGYLTVGTGESTISHLLKSSRHRELIATVEKQCYGFFMGDSRNRLPSLVKPLTTVLNQTPSDLESDDIVFAIQSSEFRGLSGISWGLLLSKEFRPRFYLTVIAQYETRKKHEARNDRMPFLIWHGIRSPNATIRVQTIEGIPPLPNDEFSIAVLLVTVLSGDHRDKDANVRLHAIRKLTCMAMDNRLTPCAKAIIRHRINGIWHSEDELREDLQFLMDELNLSVKSSRETSGN